MLLTLAFNREVMKMKTRMSLSRTSFQEHGIRLPALFVADGGTKEGSALIDTASYGSVLSSAMATKAGVCPLVMLQQVELTDGRSPHLQRHGPLTVILESSFMTIRFDTITVGKGDNWDLLIGRDVLSRYMGFCWDPQEQEVLVTALSSRVHIN